MTQAPRQAALYLRISRDKAGQGLGVTRQEKACRDLADRLGIEVGEVFTDNDISATSGKPRPAYTRMCEAIRAGAFGQVIVWSNDRLHRRFDDVVTFGQLVEATGVKVETVTSGALDFDLASERSTMTYIGSVLAAQEVARRRSRVLEKHRELAERGMPAGGPRRFGYEPDAMTVRKSEAKIVKELAARILAGESMVRICEDLNRRKVPTVFGKQWVVTTLRSTMLSPRLAGYRRHQGDEFPAAWPAILDRRTHDRLVRRLTARTQAAPRSYLLTGTLVCSDCDRGMVGKPSNDEPAYVCIRLQGGCGRTVKAATVEQYLTSEVAAAVDSGEVAARMLAGRSEEAGDAHDRVVALEADLRGLAEDHGHGLLTREEWQGAREPLSARLQAARADLSRLEAVEASGLSRETLEDWHTLWEAATTTTRARMLRGVLDRVEVGAGTPGPTFRPERFRLVWAV